MEIIERQTSIAWRSTIRVPISANYGCIMYSNPVPVSVHPRDKDRRPRILTAGRARQKGDSNESSLTLSRDKRRGRVARNTTHSSVHSCPVSSFSGRPCTLRPSSLSCAAASTTSAIQLSFPILPGRTGPISPAFVSSSLLLPPLAPTCLQSASSPRFTIVHPRRLLSYYFVGARGPQVYLSFCTALLSLLLAAIPAYKHRGFI